MSDCNCNSQDVGEHRPHKTTCTVYILIDETGSYRTRKGEIVTIEKILATDMNRYNAVGHYTDGTFEQWKLNGRLLPFSLSDNDIVEKISS